MRKAFANWQFRAYIYGVIFVTELFAGLRIYEIIDKTSDAIQAWAVTILAGITAVYAWQTKTQADASVKMAEGILRPVIIITPTGVSSAGGEHELTITLTNEGSGPALNVKVFLSQRGEASEHEPIPRPPLKPGGQDHPTLRLKSKDETSVFSVITDYNSADGQPWHSKLENPLAPLAQRRHEIGEGHYQT